MNDFLDSHPRAEAADGNEPEQPAVSAEVPTDDALDALEELAIQYGKRMDADYATLPMQRAWRFAKTVLVNAGRRVR